MGQSFQRAKSLHSRDSGGTTGEPPAVPLLSLLCTPPSSPHPRQAKMSMEELNRIVDAHGHAFNHIHASAAVAQAQRLCRGPVRPGTREAAIVDKVLGLLGQKLPDLEARHVSNGLWAVAKMGVGNDSCGGLFGKLAAKVGSDVPLSSFNPQGLSNVLWSFATIGHQDPSFVDTVLLEAERKLPEFNEQDLANTIWALATLDHPNAEAFVNKLLVEAEHKLPGFNSQALTNTVWSLATLGHPNTEAFVNKMLIEAERKLYDFSAQHLANTVWALARLEHNNNAAFVNKLLFEAERKLQDFSPQQMANTLWALAKLRHPHAIVATMLVEAERKLQSFTSQQMANTVWALATLGHPNTKAFVSKLLIEAERKLPGFNSQHLSNTLWALATLKHPNACAFIIALLHEAERKLPDFKSQELANTSWALAELRHHDDHFIALVARLALGSNHRFDSKHIGQLIISLACLGYSDPAFYDGVGKQLLSCPDIHPQAVGNVLHGLAMAGLCPPWAMELLLESLPAMMQQQTGGRASQHVVDPRNLRQTLQFILMLEARGLLSPGVESSQAYQQLRERCCLAWVEGIMMTCRESKSQREVFEVLRHLPGCSGAVCERQTEDGLFSMDIGLELPSAQGRGSLIKLAIEVDGPHHFMSNKPTMATGETLLRNLLLEARGWRVVSVAVGHGVENSVWERLNDSDRAEYLEGLLAKALESSSGGFIHNNSILT